MAAAFAAAIVSLFSCGEPESPDFDFEQTPVQVVRDMSILQTDRGEYELRLKVVEQDMDMMRLSLSLPTRELADHLAQRWPQKAGKIYETVIRILSEDEA